MIIFEYFISAFVIGSLFVIGWITVFMMVAAFLTNQFDYYHSKSNAALAAKDFDKATVYNERLQVVTKRLTKVEHLLYFQFFV